MAKKETLKEFEKVYNATYNDITKYVVCHCKNITDVEDILQNIYCSVYNILLKEKMITKEYMLGIAKHKIKDYYRFCYNEKWMTLFFNKEEQEYNYPSSINIEKSITLKLDTELVWNFLKRKKVIIFQIFYLYYVLELTIKEIASLLHLTESNVKHYLYRTLHELQEIVKKEEI